MKTISYELKALNRFLCTSIKKSTHYPEYARGIKKLWQIQAKIKQLIYFGKKRCLSH